MKIASFPILVSLFLAGCAVAADPFPSALKDAPSLEGAEVASATLPAALQKHLMEAEVFDQGSGKLPEALTVLKIDLNSDSKMEFLVTDPEYYTGGWMVHLFSSEDSGCKPLGAIQGEAYLAEPVNGYYQVVYTARAGGDTYERRNAVFKDGSYVDVKSAEYKIKENGDLVFVKMLEQ